MQKCHEQHTQQLQQFHNQMYQNTSTLTDWVCAQLDFMKKQLKVGKWSDLKHLREEISTENSALMTHYNGKFSQLKRDTELKSQDIESYLRKELSAMNEILKHLMARERELNAINPPVDAGHIVVVAHSESRHRKLSTAASTRVLRSSSQPKSSRRRYDQNSQQLQLSIKLSRQSSHLICWSCSIISLCF